MGVETFFHVACGFGQEGKTTRATILTNQSSLLPSLFYLSHDLPCQYKPDQVNPLFLEPGLANSATWCHISVKKD